MGLARRKPVTSPEPKGCSRKHRLAHSSNDFGKVREGIVLTLRQLTGAFEKGHIVEVNPVGEKFDPHLHQAISMVPAKQEANTVVTVLQKGYAVADRVLRPALVTVAAPT
jgi:molecular chaperone GrpE